MLFVWIFSVVLVSSTTWEYPYPSDQCQCMTFDVTLTSRSLLIAIVAIFASRVILHSCAVRNLFFSLISTSTPLSLSLLLFIVCRQSVLLAVFLVFGLIFFLPQFTLFILVLIYYLQVV